MTRNVGGGARGWLRQCCLIQTHEPQKPPAWGSKDYSTLLSVLGCLIKYLSLFGDVFSRRDFQIRYSGSALTTYTEETAYKSGVLGGPGVGLCWLRISELQKSQKAGVFLS